MSILYKCFALAMYVYTLHICNVGNKSILYYINALYTKLQMQIILQGSSMFINGSKSVTYDITRIH